MNELFRYANQYVRESDWRDLSLLKICLCAIGILIGLSVPKNKKDPVLFAAGAVAVLTGVPLMAKFLKIIKNENEFEDK